MKTPPQRCLTGQGWSLTDLEYIRIRALRDISTTSHMQALLHLYDSPDSVGFTYKYQSVRGMWPPQTSSHNLKEHRASLDSCYTTQSTQCRYFRNRRGRSWGSSVECLLHRKRGDLYLGLALSKKDITRKEDIYSCLLQNRHVGSISVS